MNDFLETLAGSDVGARDQPRVFLDRDTHFYRTRLSTIVSENDCEVVKAAAGVSVMDALREIDPPPDLLLLHVASETLSTVRALRAIAGYERVPILGITALDRSQLDLLQLRELGIVGLIDKSAIPEHIIFRVNRVVRDLDSGRRYERAPCYMAVDVEFAGEVATEYALNLSLSGMSLTSARSIEPNSDLRLRFALPSQPGELLRANGRVIYKRRARSAGVDWELGVFLYPLAPAVRRGIAGEVARLLEG